MSKNVEQLVLYGIIALVLYTVWTKYQANQNASLIGASSAANTGSLASDVAPYLSDADALADSGIFD